MSRRVYLLMPLFVALVSVCYAGYPTSRFTISAGNKDGWVGYLGVDEGQLILGSPSSRRARLDRDEYDRWHFLGTKIKSSVGGGYLAYDPTGKDHKVFLTPKADGEGTDWIVRRQKFGVERKNERRDIEEWGFLQVASGPMKDWFFDVEDVQEMSDDGQIKKVRRYILSKEPSWNVEVARIHTTAK